MKGQFEPEDATAAWVDRIIYLQPHINNYTAVQYFLRGGQSFATRIAGKSMI